MTGLDEQGARALVADLIGTYSTAERVEEIDLRSNDPDFIVERISAAPGFEREWVH